MKISGRPAWPLGLAAFCATLALGGCGSSSSTATPTGTVSVAVTDAPSADFDKVWVTLRAVRFHTTDAAGPDDAGWLTYTLPAPVTVNLADLGNGALNTVFSNVSLPVGNYQQIRLVLADALGPLTTSASNNGLAYNDQVDYTVGASTYHAPLEIPRPEKGIALHGHFNVVAATPLHLAVDFNLDNDVVKFVHGSTTAFTLKPLLTYYDLDNAGAITGQVDTAGLYSAGNTGGAYNLVIKAEDLTADNSRHYVVRATTIRPDGTFTLFPLPIPAGQPSKNFDVLIRGRNMETVIVKGVQVSRSSDGVSNAAVLQTSAITLPTGSEYTANLSPAGAPTGAWVNFFQTVSGSGEVPYEVRFRHLDPFTGTFFDDIPLSAGNLHTGNWNSGGAISFTSAAPVEGAGNFSAVNAAPLYTAATVSLTQGSSPVAMNFGALAVDPSLTADSISGTVTQSAGKYDHGYLVVSRDGLITTSIDLGTILAGNGGTGDTYSIANLPGGSAGTAAPGMIYYLYAVVWNSANPVLSYRVVPVLSLADLRQGSATGINLSL